MARLLPPCLVALVALAATTVHAVPVSYDIGPYRAGNFAASYLHSADGCRGASDLDLNRNGRKDTLYMCGSEQRGLTGTLHGHWNGTRLTGITGVLGGYAVTGGRLGGDFYSSSMRPLWFLTLAGLGRFFFEDLPINRIGADYLTLWGQNRKAYTCKTDRCRERKAAGLDLYGRAQEESLPEPGSLAVLAAGLAGLLVTRRRRAAPLR